MNYPTDISRTEIDTIFTCSAELPWVLVNLDAHADEALAGDDHCYDDEADDAYVRALQEDDEERAREEASYVDPELAAEIAMEATGVDGGYW